MSPPFFPIFPDFFPSFSRFLAIFSLSGVALCHLTPPVDTPLLQSHFNKNTFKICLYADDTARCRIDVFVLLFCEFIIALKLWGLSCRSLSQGLGFSLMVPVIRLLCACFLRNILTGFSRRVILLECCTLNGFPRFVNKNK